MRRVVSVAACGNGSGKTTLLTTILRAFPGRFAAVKFTTVFRDGVNCPRTETACACRELHGAWSIVKDRARLEQEDTDTGRLARAGARSVHWCLARPGSHRSAWEHLLTECVPQETFLLTEGNSAIPVIAPDLLLAVLTPGVPRDRWKADAWPLVEAAAHVIVNSWGVTVEMAQALADEVAARLGGGTPSVQDVSLPLESWGDPAVRLALARLVPCRTAD